MPIQIWVACIVAAFEAMCIGGLLAINTSWGPAKSNLIFVCLVVVAGGSGYWQGRKYASDLAAKKSIWLRSLLRGMPTGFMIGLCSGIVLSTQGFYYVGSLRQSLQIFFTAHQPPVTFTWLIAGVVGLLVGVVGAVCVAALVSFNKSLFPQPTNGGI